MGESRFRSLLGAPASAILIGAMLAGCLLLWIGVPLAWLWIGSQIQGSASVGTALMVSMIGVIATIVLMVGGLSWLNRRHAELRASRELPVPDPTVLEVMLVVTAGLALVVFAVWFFGFAGTSPVPVNIGF
jgi:heme/copper-type cytochrome/quinol oxidase subunit 2